MSAHQVAAQVMTVSVEHEPSHDTASHMAARVSNDVGMRVVHGHFHRPCLLHGPWGRRCTTFCFEKMSYSPIFGRLTKLSRGMSMVIEQVARRRIGPVTWLHIKPCNSGGTRSRASARRVESAVLLQLVVSGRIRPVQPLVSVIRMSGGSDWACLLSQFHNQNDGE